jgi:hypothetical protein
MPAAAGTQVSGLAAFDVSGQCTAPPAGFEDFADFTLVLSGSLVGCLYTDIQTSTVTPSNVYQEEGQEVVVACLNTNGDADCDSDEPVGSFTTTYRFTSKWAGEPFVSLQQHGRCQHPIVPGSGKDDFAGISGRLDFKDNIVDGVAVDYDYRGHIELG